MDLITTRGAFCVPNSPYVLMLALIGGDSLFCNRGTAPTCEWMIYVAICFVLIIIWLSLFVWWLSMSGSISLHAHPRARAHTHAHILHAHAHMRSAAQLRRNWGASLHGSPRRRHESTLATPRFFLKTDQIMITSNEQDSRAADSLASPLSICVN